MASLYVREGGFEGSLLINEGSIVLQPLDKSASYKLKSVVDDGNSWTLAFNAVSFSVKKRKMETLDVTIQNLIADLRKARERKLIAQKQEEEEKNLLHRAYASKRAPERQAEIEKARQANLAQAEYAKQVLAQQKAAKKLAERRKELLERLCMPANWGWMSLRRFAKSNGVKLVIGMTRLQVEDALIKERFGQHALDV